MKTVRQGTTTDLDAIMSMVDHSRHIMRDNGNMVQWVNGYPSREVVQKDLEEGVCYVIEEDGRLVGTFAFIVGEDPTYQRIDHGSWIRNDEPYGTMHRLACAPGVNGVARCAFDWAVDQIGSVRADTHHDNGIMTHILTRYGFEYRGVIYVADGTPRDAYQLFCLDKGNK